MTDKEETVKTVDTILSERSFDTPQEFAAFYEQNKERLDKYPTAFLNRTYKVNGYIIRKNYGGITFRHSHEHPPEMNSGRRLTRLEGAVDDIMNTLNKILDRLGM